MKNDENREINEKKKKYKLKTNAKRRTKIYKTLYVLINDFKCI